MRRIALLALLATSACQCGPAGRCEGTVAGVDVTGPLGQGSEYHTLYRATGKRTEDQTALRLVCARGDFEVSARTRRITAIPTGVLPLPTCPARPGPTDGGTADGGAPDAGTGGVPCQGAEVREWAFVRPSPAPRLLAGTLEAAIELLAGDVKGETTMEFEDGSRLKLVFDLQHDASRDEDKPARSSRGGSSDWDDWD